MSGLLLCATDLTDGGQAPVDLAIHLAKAFEARVELLHVGDDLGTMVTDPVPEEVRPAAERLRARLTERRAAEDQALEAICTRVREEGVGCHGTIREGRPWETIIDAAMDLSGVTMIVVGAHGGARGDLFDRLGTRILGSTADRVVRHARHPVVVAPPSPTAPGLGDGPVVVGVDASNAATEAARAAARLAHGLGRRLVLVHVLPRSTDEDGTAQRDYVSVLQAHAEEEARTRLRTLEVGLPGTVEVRLAPVSGTPAEGLVNVARDLGAGCIVVGTHARQGAVRWVLGSTAERVLRAAEMPVMVVPPGAALGAQG